MDPTCGLPPIVIEMEDETYAPSHVLPESIPITTVERKILPPINKLTKYSGSDNRADYQKVDTKERRQFRAHPKCSNTEAGTRLLSMGKTFTGPPEGLKNPQIFPLLSFAAAERDKALYGDIQEHVEVLGEGMRAESMPTTSTDSGKEISKNGDKSSSGTYTLRSSGDSKIVKKKLHNSVRCATGSTIVECEHSSIITKAWFAFEKSWEVQVKLTQEERRNGYRFSEKIDPAYLGFYPSRSDKRKFLKAYPIIGHVPEAKWGCDCWLPVSFGQWSFIVGFFVVFGALGVGAFFLLRHKISSLG